MSLLKSHWKDIFYFILSKINKKYGTNIEVNFWGDITKASDFDERDFVLWANTVKELPIRRNFYIYLFDQGSEWRTRNGCVVINWYLWVCNNTGREPDYNEIHEWLDYFESINVWWEDKGASIPTIVKQGQKRWNKLNPEDKLIYFRMNYKDAVRKEALDKWYELLGGRYTFPEYSKDKKDGTINFWNYEWWKKKGWHALNTMKGDALNAARIFEIKKGDTQIERNTGEIFWDNSIYAVNSYPGTQKDYNIYQHDHLDEHCENGIWFEWFYLTVAANDFEAPVDEIKEDIKSVKQTKNEELRKLFKTNSRYAHIIIDQVDSVEDLIFNNFKEDGVATIADVKELIQIYHNRKK